MSSNTYNAFNKWKSTKIFGSLEVKDYVIDGSVSDTGVITITSPQLPTTENSQKVATTAWVKSIITNLLNSDNMFNGKTTFMN